jgi:hypothetical protein
MVPSWSLVPQPKKIEGKLTHRLLKSRTRISPKIESLVHKIFPKPFYNIQQKIHAMGRTSPRVYKSVIFHRPVPSTMPSCRSVVDVASSSVSVRSFTVTDTLSETVRIIRVYKTARVPRYTFNFLDINLEDGHNHFDCSLVELCPLYFYYAHFRRLVRQ